MIPEGPFVGPAQQNPRTAGVRAQSKSWLFEYRHFPPYIVLTKDVIPAWMRVEEIEVTLKDDGTVVLSPGGRL